jgi:hypothetical protein
MIQQFRFAKERSLRERETRESERERERERRIVEMTFWSKKKFEAGLTHRRDAIVSCSCGPPS